MTGNRVVRSILLVPLLGFVGRPSDDTPAEPETAICVVSHVDVIPPFTVQGRDLLRQHVADSKKDDGATRIEVFEEIARPNHSTIVSVWASRKAFDAHVATEHARTFRARIQPMLGSPFDERLHRPGT